MKSIAIYISSRNNYDLLESVFLKNIDLEGYQLFNIDDNSEPDEVEKGKNICEKNNIKFIPNKGRGLQWSAQTMIDSVEDNIKYIIWTSHDTFTLTPNFFKKIDEKVSTGCLDQFGMVGFNAFGPQCGYSYPSQIKSNTCGILGRAFLMKLPVPDPNKAWYRTPDVDLNWEVWGKFPCTVDAPNSFFEMFNVELFKKYIKPTDGYHLFYAHDDIALQFLNVNVYNIVLPKYLIWHNQYMKQNTSVPVRSSHAAQAGDKKHFGDWNLHIKTFKTRWGWDRQYRSEFEKVSNMYKGTLIYDIHNHDFLNGPFKIFDI